MSERRLAFGQLNHLAPVEVEREISGLILNVLGYRAFVFGDLEKGNFGRIRVLDWDHLSSQVAISEVSDFQERLVKKYQVRNGIFRNS